MNTLKQKRIADIGNPSPTLLSAFSYIPCLSFKELCNTVLLINSTLMLSAWDTT